MGKLTGKVAVITGCSVGLGKQMALRFAAEGANLAICARSADKLAVTARECEAKGVQVLAMPVDLTNVDQLTAFVEAVAAKFGTIDILVNNAVSIAPPHSFL
ncbi:MAG: SDR family NAD(P)-dependent oxidoreductase [Ruminiclostridium sp.]|nr:SDR family NAD(P)-dependent oxidoreductase [Ruminiclostridium sp.]